SSLLPLAPGQCQQRAEVFPGPPGTRPHSVVLHPGPTRACSVASHLWAADARGPVGPAGRTVPPQHRLATAPHALLPAASREAPAFPVQPPCSDRPPAPVGSLRCRRIVLSASGQFAGGSAGGYS